MSDSVSCQCSEPATVSGQSAQFFKAISAKLLGKKSRKLTQQLQFFHGRTLFTILLSDQSLSKQFWDHAPWCNHEFKLVADIDWLTGVLTLQRLRFLCTIVYSAGLLRITLRCTCLFVAKYGSDGNRLNLRRTGLAGPLRLDATAQRTGQGVP